MMTQEEFMEVQVLHAAGWTIRQIAEHVGYHPATGSGMSPVEWWGSRDAILGGRHVPGWSSAVTAGSVSRV